MESVRQVLGDKDRTFKEKLRWVNNHPPDLPRRADNDRDRDERCGACGGLIHDDSEADGPRCRCAGALRRCAEYVDRADPGQRMTFDTLRDVHPSAKRAAVAARRVATGEQRGLAMFGPPGTGKTHVAVAACRLALANRTTAAFWNVVELVGRVQATYGSGWHEESRADVIAGVARRELVVLDDLGKERDTSDVRTIIYELVDALYRSGTRLIIASNLGADEYRDRFDTAVSSRIAGMCEALPVLGRDRRRS